MADEAMIDLQSDVDVAVGDLANLTNAPDDALLVVEYLGKAYNTTLGQLKAALGTITSFNRTQGDGKPGSTDVYTVTFGDGKKLEMSFSIPKNGADAVSPTAEVTETDTGWHVVITDKNGEHPFDISNGKNGKDGKDGISPTAEVAATDTGWHVVITDKNGQHPFDISNGKNGKDGADAVSPTAEVTETDTGWRVVITDKNGQHPFDISNGKNGADAVSPTAKVTETDTGWHVVITDKNGEHPFDISNGKNGRDGKDGKDGVSATATVSSTDTGWHVVITDKNGEQDFDLLHGVNGKDGFSPEVSVQQVGGGYRVTIIDKDGAQTFTLRNGENSSADWAQKYPDGTGYVKNRIAYKDTFGVDGKILDATISFRTNIASASGLQSAALERDGKYTVLWDGVRYDCICKQDSTGEQSIGNEVLNGGAEDTGEPFYIFCLGGTIYTVIKSTETAEDVTVVVTGEAVVDLKKLDGELLPEGVPHKEIEENVTLFEKTDLTSATYFHSEAIGLQKGESYEAVVNGNFYDVTPVPYEGVNGDTGLILVKDDGSVRNQYNIGLPFTFVEYDAASAAMKGYYAFVRSDLLDGNGKYRISITGDRVTWHKLDGGFLPDAVQISLSTYGIDLQTVVDAGGSATVNNTVLLWETISDAWENGDRVRVSVPVADTELIFSDPTVCKVGDAGLCLLMNTMLTMDTSFVALYIMLSPGVNNGTANTAETTVYVKSVMLG